MPDTPAQPPGWPYNQDPNAVPETPDAPAYEPPPLPQPPVPQPPMAPPPGAPQYESPQYESPQYESPQHQAPPQPASPGQPPAPYPAAPGQSPYEPPVPGAPPYGGPGQPPPPNAWGPPPAPVKKRRSLWATFGIIMAVLLLGIGGCTFWFVRTVTAPVDTSNEFLAAIDRGDYQAAIELSDPGCSRGMSASDLAATFQGADITYNLNNSSITNSSATVSGSFSIQGQDLSTIQVFLQNNDGWQVCGFNAN